VREDGAVHPTPARGVFGDEPVWFHEPARWRRAGPELSLSTDPGTDFWRHTGHGYVRDNGHFLGMRVPGEFVAAVEVEGDYRDQHDQAGLMVRMDAERWVKCGIEYVDGVAKVSAVVTHGVSDWSVAPLPAVPQWLQLKVTRTGDTLKVEYGVDGSPLQLHRLAFLPPDLPVSVGPMACSPDGQGFDVRFRGFDVRSQ
jgi:hypothetical protein